MGTLLNRTTPKSSKRSEPQAAPTSFLAKCKAIVDSVTSPRRSVPLPLKHRVQDFRPRPRAAYNTRRLSLLIPEWNESSAKRTEMILGTILVIIAIFLLRPSEEASFITGNVEEQTAEEEARGPMPEIPYLSAVASDPTVFQQLAPASPCPTFHSFANPSARFDFKNEPRWKKEYLSTSAACGVANHLELNMPSMLVTSKQSGANGHKQTAHLTGKATAHPLVNRMMRQMRALAYERYLSSHPGSPAAMPLLGAIGRYRTLSRVFKESYGQEAEDGGESGGESSD